VIQSAGIIIIKTYEIFIEWNNNFNVVMWMS
jgi:hypothetical protein